MEIFTPSSKFEDSGPIEFVIDNATDKFLDLNNSFLKVKCKIAKANGQNGHFDVLDPTSDNT